MLKIALYSCYIKRIFIEAKLENLLLDDLNNIKLTNIENGMVSLGNFDFKLIGRIFYEMVTGKELENFKNFDFSNIPKGFCKDGLDLFQNIMNGELNSFYSIQNHRYFTQE